MKNTRINFRKEALCIPLLFLAVAAGAQIKLSSDTLHWKNDKCLSWNDFKGKPEKGVDASGEVACVILSGFNKKNPLKKTKPETTAILDRSHSWILANSKKPEELAYYQVIFNIYEWYARKLRKEFNTTKFGIDPNKVFQEKYNANEAELTDTVGDFRRESELGADQKIVMEWDAKVKKEIKALEEFKD